MSDRIEHTIHIEADAAIVFAALTSRDLLALWLGHRVEVEARLGGKYDLHWSAEDNGATVNFHAAAEVTAFTPGQLLSLKLAPGDGPSTNSEIDIRLTVVGNGTDVTVTQTGFDGDANPKAYSRGWLQCLSVLRSLLEDEPDVRCLHAPMHRDIQLPAHDPCGIEWDGKSLWISDAGSGRIYELDPLTGEERSSIPFEGEPSGLAFDGEHLWQGDREERTLFKLARKDGKVLKKLKLAHIEGELTGVTWDGENLWVGDAGEDGGKALRVNPKSGIILARCEVARSVSGLAWDGKSLWAADFEARVVLRLDPTTGAVTRRVAVKGHPTGLAWDGSRLWYADSEFKVCSRILDPVFGD